eukprot:s171_g50.t1
MAAAASAPLEICGTPADSGASLVKKFKRVSIQGGRLRGAKYGDISEADIRQSARSYRGDARFSQFCKQWVAAETLAHEPEVGHAPHLDAVRASTTVTEPNTWREAVLRWTSQFLRWIKDRSKGRVLSVTCITVFCMIVISRPAFGRLCGRLIGLAVRIAIRRTLGLVMVILDNILEEAIVQVETVMIAGPEPGQFNTAPQMHVAPAHYFWMIGMNFLSLLVGSLLGDYFTHEISKKHPPVPVFSLTNGWDNVPGDTGMLQNGYRRIPHDLEPHWSKCPDEQQCFLSDIHSDPFTESLTVCFHDGKDPNVCRLDTQSWWYHASMQTDHIILWRAKLILTGSSSDGSRCLYTTLVGRGLYGFVIMLNVTFLLCLCLACCCFWCCCRHPGHKGERLLEGETQSCFEDRNLWSP